jgi:hypothetical protein
MRMILEKLDYDFKISWTFSSQSAEKLLSCTESTETSALKVSSSWL